MFWRNTGVYLLPSTLSRMHLTFTPEKTHSVKLDFKGPSNRLIEE